MCTSLQPPTNEKGIVFACGFLISFKILTSKAGCMYSAAIPCFLKVSTKSGVDEKTRSMLFSLAFGSNGDEIHETIFLQNGLTDFEKSPKNSGTYSR
jgi:hypothetical protein